MHYITDITLQTGVVLLYCLPTVSTYYITAVEPWTTPVILPLTQVAMTGAAHLYIIEVAATFRDRFQLFTAYGIRSIL